MKNLCLALLVLLHSGISPAHAAAQQDHATIRATALAYLQEQTQSLPGKVSLQVGDIDPRTVLRACGALEAFLPAGAQLIGKTSVGVRCNRQPVWSVFLQATVRVNATLLVSNRPLAQNTVLSADDFSLQSGELGQPGLLTDPAQAVGKTLKFGIGAGQALRQDMLRAPYVVTQGQTTEVRVQSKGFSVRSAGQALNNGAAGQKVQVRMASGQVISGTARADGSVEVRP
ncbi:MAG: flagellar basal body P-ring formation protein FlgA [Nitrosomonadales bacterium]|nr:flagellar basal body P-ring formation protein FlgA [Nitrosomonadales bacterium]